MKINCCVRPLLAGIFALFHFSLSVRANVYATNIKFNNSLNNAAILQGGTLSISYILNEPATAGALVEILSDTNVVRAISLAAGNPGTARGTNSILWDSKDNLGSNVVVGSYGVRITAGANGYDTWTQISDDDNAGNSVLTPRGIAVNQNTNSPFYGRVFVGNAFGDQVGILKLNADGSAADDGIFSTGGYPWAGDFYSPWKIEVSADDKVYVNDWHGNGIVLAFDQLISSNAYSTVLRQDNWPGDGMANLSGPFITGAGTNTQVWMADINYIPPGSPANGVGIVRWNVTTNGTLATNDIGTVIVQPRFGSDLNIYPYDMAVDKSNRIYTIQTRANSGDSANRVMRFPKYDESGNPETTADWKVGSGDDTLANAFGVAVNPAATYVAVAVRGIGSPGSWQNGGTTIFQADTGIVVTNITKDTTHDHTDVAWDNVGNLYDCDNFDSLWRTYSPPGTNQATTIAVETIQVLDQFISPLLTPVSWSNDQFQFTLAGQSNVSYVIQASTNLNDWISVTTNYSLSEVRTLNLAAPDSQTFFRAVIPP